MIFDRGLWVGSQHINMRAAKMPHEKGKSGTRRTRVRPRFLRSGISCHNPAQTMIYDVTVPISNSMHVWPGDPAVRLTSKSHLSRDKTHTIRLTEIEMGSHTGTHIDAPLHMIDGGKRLNDFSLEVLAGKATDRKSTRLNSSH